MTKKFLAIVLFAACLRFGRLHHDGGWDTPLRLEPTEEVIIARGLADGRGFVSPFQDKNRSRTDLSAHSPPGYPFLLAGIIRAARIFSADEKTTFRAALLVNILVGSVAVGLLAVVGRRARGSAGFWVTGLVAGCWPTLVQMSGVLWDTPYSMLAAGLALLLVTSPGKEPIRRRSLAIVGGAWGVFTLFNPLLGPFLAVALAALAARGSGLFSPRVAVGMLAACGVWALCLAPWEVRNTLAFHRFVPIRHNFGLELWMGNLPESDGTTTTVNRWHPMNDPGERLALTTMGDDAYMQWKSRQASALVRGEPRRFLALTRRRVVIYWFGNYEKPTSLSGRTLPMLRGVNLLKVTLNALLVGCAVLGSFEWRSRPARWVFWAGMFFLPLPYYVTHVAPNYRAFLDLLLCLPASLMVVTLAQPLLDKWSQWREERGTEPVAVRRSPNPSTLGQSGCVVRSQ